MCRVYVVYSNFIRRARRAYNGLRTLKDVNCVGRRQMSVVRDALKKPKIIIVRTVFLKLYVRKYFSTLFQCPLYFPSEYCAPVIR